jgi:hypothetical protein
MSRRLWPPSEWLSTQSPDQRSYRVDFSRLAAAFPDLRQEWDARRGARDLARRIREHQLTDTDRRRFTRLSRLAQLRERRALSPSLRWEAAAPVPDADHS